MTPPDASSPDLTRGLAPLVLGFGENSVDYVYRLPRYPQPGPSSKVAILHRDVRVGGQVATTLATCVSLGMRARYAGVFGTDQAGARVRDELAARGVDTRHAVVRDAPNRYAVILLDTSTGERVVLSHRDERLALAADTVRREWLNGASLVHVDATDAPAAIALARLARDAGLPVTCDIDTVTPDTATLLDLVTLPILAEHIPAAIAGTPDTAAALRALRRPHHQRLVVTRGAAGAAMLDGHRYLEAAAYPVTVVDSTGAGDVFRGAFICALLRGDAPDAMLRFANAAAAVACTREGAMDSVPTGEEVAGIAIHDCFYSRFSSTNPSGGTTSSSE